VKKGLKIVLIVSIVLIIVVVVAAVQVFGLHTFIGPRKRKLTGQTFASTPARLERGEYIANSMGCLYCHSPHDWSKRDEPILSGMAGPGGSCPIPICLEG